MIIDQAITAPLGEAQKPKPRRPSGWQRRKAAKERQREQFLAALTDEGRAAEVQPPSRVPETLSEIAAEMRRLFWESRRQLIPRDIAASQSYIGLNALKATEAETQARQIDEYLRQRNEPRQQQLAYRYGTDIAVEPAQVQQP
jgi:hypothetical protein